LNKKANQDFVQDMLERLNNLESKMYRPKTHTTHKYFDDDEHDHSNVNAG
jgi:hypothetical protein